MSNRDIHATVLVVEDDLQLRRSIAHMLRRHGFQVLEAGSGFQGLDLAERHSDRLALAVVDMVMPGMSGLDLAAEFARTHRRIKILYISGYVTSIAMQAIADRSPEAVLLKPFTEQRLVDRVRTMLGMATGEPGRPDPLPQPVENSWRLLVEASDPIEQPYRIASYRPTPAACSIAAVHSAVLRQCNLPYCFRRHRETLYPFELLVEAGQWQSARDAIALAGLGADINIAS